MQIKEQIQGNNKRYEVEYVKISYMFDKEMLTPYKASPTDCGEEIFYKLYNERVNLY